MSATTNVLNDAFHQYYEESCDSLRKTITHYNNITKHLPEPTFTKKEYKINQCTMAIRDNFRQANNTYKKIFDTFENMIKDYNKLESNDEEKKIIDVCAFQNKITNYTEKMDELINKYLAEEANAKKITANSKNPYANKKGFSWKVFLAFLFLVLNIASIIIVHTQNIFFTTDDSLYPFAITGAVILGIIFGIAGGIRSGIGGIIIQGLIGLVVGGLLGAGLSYSWYFFMERVIGNILFVLLGLVISSSVGKKLDKQL